MMVFLHQSFKVLIESNDYIYRNTHNVWMEYKVSYLEMFGDRGRGSTQGGIFSALPGKLPALFNPIGDFSGQRPSESLWVYL